MITYLPRLVVAGLSMSQCFRLGGPSLEFSCQTAREGRAVATNFWQFQGLSGVTRLSESR
jgi:hypothetical protein